MKPKVSIIVLCYNAPGYCWKTFSSLRKTQYASYEVIAVDNHSRFRTKLVLFLSYLLGRIHKLCFLNANTLFAGGNNFGARLAAADSPLLLLLNSDILIKDPLWLDKLTALHERGASAYGYVEGGAIPRADGYCFMIDKDLYLEYQLDEFKYPWWWSITKLQSQLLTAGHSVKAVSEHDHILLHYGGKSGTEHLKKRKDFFEEPDLHEWFRDKRVQIAEVR